MVDSRSTSDLVLDFAHVAHELGAFDKLIDILVHVCREGRVCVLVGCTLVVGVLPCQDLVADEQVEGRG